MPLISDVQFDELLTNVSIQYQPAQGGYLADDILPPIAVKKESGVFWKYDKSRFDVPDSIRAPRSHYNKIDWSTLQDTYAAAEYGLEGEIDDRERDNSVAPLDLDVDTAEITTDMMLNNREGRVATLVLNASVVTNGVDYTSTPGLQWSDPGSDPILAATTARNNLFGRLGYKPNKLLLGNDVYEILRAHPAIVERIQFSERAIITKQILAALFEVDEILVGGVLRRTSQQGATDVIADIWAGAALFFYSENRPSLKRASFGYQFRVRDLRTFKYRDDSRATDIVRVTEIQGEKLIAPELGYLVRAAIA